MKEYKQNNLGLGNIQSQLTVNMFIKIKIYKSTGWHNLIFYSV